MYFTDAKVLSNDLIGTGDMVIFAFSIKYSIHLCMQTLFIIE